MDERPFGPWRVGNTPVATRPEREPATEARMKYRVLIQQDEDGVFVAEVPSLPGCISQGQTRSEATENIREAILAYLESLEAHGEPIPPSIEEEVVEVAV
jgi:predicted RNase H-like HicB family nuclease